MVKRRQHTDNIRHERNGCGDKTNSTIATAHSTQDKVGKKAWRSDDCDLPAEYYLELDEVDDLDNDEQDYAPGTTSMLNWIEDQWHDHNKKLHQHQCPLDPYAPRASYKDLSIKRLYAFFDWMLKQRYGKNERRRRGTKTASSLGLYWKLFRLVYERAVGSKLDSNWDRRMHKALRRLAEKHGLSLKSREKTPMDVDDLTLMNQTTLSSTKVTFNHGRQRVQACLFPALMSISGNRPGAILKLRYRDIQVTLLRDPEGGPHKRLIEFTPEFTKGFLGLKEGTTWPVPEIIFDPSLLLSPHVYLLALIFLDEAFAAPSLKTPADLSKLYIEDFLNEQRLPLREDIRDCYVFRQPVKTLQDVEVPLDAAALQYSTILRQMKMVGNILGMANVIPYGLRYNAGAEFDADGQVSDSMRNLMMRHADTRTFLRHYLPKRVTVDARAIVHGLPQQRALMKAASRMGRSIDPRRPYELNEVESQLVNQNPRVVSLTRRREEMKRRFQGTIQSHKGTTLYDDYKALSQELINERQRQKRKRLKGIRESFDKQQPILDIERQLSGRKLARGLRQDIQQKLSQMDDLRTEHKEMIATIMTLPATSLEEEYQRRDAAIIATIAYCKVEEGRSIRMHRRSPVGSKPALRARAEDNASDRQRKPLAPLQHAISSVYREKRPRYCFICLGNDKLPMQSRTHRFYTSGDLTKHIRRRHLSKLADGEAGECRLCRKHLRDKQHLQHHALRVHGTFS